MAGGVFVKKIDFFCLISHDKIPLKNMIYIILVYLKIENIIENNHHSNTKYHLNKPEHWIYQAHVIFTLLNQVKII